MVLILTVKTVDLRQIQDQRGDGDQAVSTR